MNDTAGAPAPVPSATVHAADKEGFPDKLNVLFLPAFALVILAGAGLHLTAESRARSAAFEAITNCQATMAVSPVEKRRGNSNEVEVDGLNDWYGYIKLAGGTDGVTDYLSLCDTNPPLALTVLRDAFASGKDSAKIVALHASFLLARSAVLENADVQRMIKFIDPTEKESEDVRRAATKALSELVLIRSQSAAAFEKLPASLPPKSAAKPASEKKDGDDKKDEDKEPETVTRKILTRAKQGVKDEHLIRWSDSEVAFYWWKEHAGQGSWDQKSGNYIIK